MVYDMKSRDMGELLSHDEKYLQQKLALHCGFSDKYRELYYEYGYKIILIYNTLNYVHLKVIDVGKQTLLHFNAYELSGMELISLTISQA